MKRFIATIIFITALFGGAVLLQELTEPQNYGVQGDFPKYMESYLVDHDVDYIEQYMIDHKGE